MEINERTLKRLKFIEDSSFNGVFSVTREMVLNNKERIWKDCYNSLSNINLSDDEFIEAVKKVYNKLSITDQRIFYYRVICGESFKKITSYETIEYSSNSVISNHYQKILELIRYELNILRFPSSKNSRTSDIIALEETYHVLDISKKTRDCISRALFADPIKLLSEISDEQIMNIKGVGPVIGKEIKKLRDYFRRDLHRTIKITEEMVISNKERILKDCHFPANKIPIFTDNVLAEATVYVYYNKLSFKQRMIFYYRVIKGETFREIASHEEFDFSTATRAREIYIEALEEVKIRTNTFITWYK